MNGFIQTGIGILVLMFTVPIFFSTAQDAVNDENVSASGKAIMTFLPILYTLGILTFSADGLLTGITGEGVRQFGGRR